MEAQSQLSTTALARNVGYVGQAGAAEAKLLEVPHQLEMLERTMKGIDQGLEHLSNRLSSSILRPEGPAAPGNGGNSAPTAVQNTHIGSRLQEANSHAARLNDFIQSLIQRLEA